MGELRACLRAFGKQQQAKSCGSVFKVSFITALLQDNTCQVFSSVDGHEQ